MTGAWADVPAHPRAMTGTNAFRLIPDDAMHEAPATATVRSSAGGHALVLTYTWEHAEDGPQDGVLLVASADDGGVVHATLLDSWHQHPAPMHLTGRMLPGGLGASVSAVYAEVYGWEVDVRLDAGELAMDMRNVLPAEDVPQESAGAATATRYDVMLLRVG